MTMNRRGFLGTLGAAATAPLLLKGNEAPPAPNWSLMGARAQSQDGKVYYMGVAMQACQKGDLIWVQTYGYGIVHARM